MYNIYIYILPKYTTVSIPLVLYHSPVCLSSPLPSPPNVSISCSLLHTVVLPTDIIWISFDSVLQSFSSQLSLWSGGIVQYYMSDTSNLYCRVASYFNSKSFIYLIKLPYFVIIFTDFIIIAPIYLHSFPVLNLPFIV